MVATIIDGKRRAIELRERIAAEVGELKGRGISPGLAVVLVGSDAASQVYVRSKRVACAQAGIASFSHDLPETASEAELLSLIARLNGDPAVHGILVQLPLPKQIDQQHILCALDPEKDVDGFHPCNVGRLSLGRPCLAPCTPAAVIDLLDWTGVEIRGKIAVVIGRSNIVGKPVANLLAARDATLVLCHRATVDLAAEVRRAEILVSAAGQPNLVRGGWIRPGAVVIDVGINRLPDGRLTGDVEFEEAARRAGAITPVPGGVGPVTIAMLLRNTLDAAKHTSPHDGDCLIRRPHAPKDPAA